MSSDHLRSQVVPLLIMSLSGCSDGVLTYGKEQQGAPACAITAPTDGATVEEGPVDLCAVVTDADTPADQLSVAWALGSGEELGDGSIPDTSGLSCLAVDLDIGAHAVEAAVTDPGGLQGVCTISFSMTPPDAHEVAPAPSVTPSPATTTEDLVATLSTVPLDADGQELDVTWSWAVDGEVQAALTDALVPAGITTRGEVWTVTVTASSGEGSASVEVINSPPTAPSIVLTPGEPTETLDTLHCGISTDSEDPDEDPVSYAISWTLDGALWAGTTDTLDQPGDLLPVEVLDEHQTWTCTATPFDGTDEGPPEEAETTVLERFFEGVTAGAWHACAWDDLGRTTCWGDDSDHKVSDTPADAFVEIDASTHHTCGITDGGELRCWGIDDGSAWDKGQVTDVPGGSGWTTLGAAGTNNCATDSAGALTCWGSTDDGRSNPPGGTGFVEVVGGVSWLCASPSSGSVSCWGEHANGVGSEPTDMLSGLSGGNHACGIRRADSTVHCWGYDDMGQTAAQSETFQMVTAGQKHSCGVVTDGTLRCWGSNIVGESSPPSGTYTAVSAASHVDDSVDYFSCAIDTDHEVVCWGADTFGQLSDRP